MRTPLRLLIVEDNEDDAELLLRAVRRAHEVHHRRVESAEEMTAALTSEPWDLIVSDFSLPSFDAMGALAVLEKSELDIPFILISGTIGEETAVEAMKAGANDFVVKGRLARLLPAIERELRDARTRQERREAIARVQQSERRLSVVFSQVAVGMMETNLDGEILLVNQRLCDLVDRPRERVIGARLQDLAHPDDVDTLRSVFERIRSGEQSVVAETRCVRADGTHAWLNSTVSVVSAADGEPCFTVTVVQDVTARKRAEDELRAAIRARDDFLSIASHELKTPITSLQPQLERVSRTVSEARAEPIPLDKMAWRLGIMTRQVERLKALVDNLLDVTTITSGRLRISPKETDLRNLAVQVVDAYRDVIRHVGSEILLTAEQPVVGRWDPLALERVLTNLLSNAAKFGGGRPIEVTIEQAGSMARMVVMDHGIGIAPEQTQRIFQRFEQAVPPEHYGGLGLGLWIARQVAGAHGGSIRVESSPSGSTFTVELPLEGAGGDDATGLA